MHNHRKIAALRAGKSSPSDAAQRESIVAAGIALFEKLRDEEVEEKRCYRIFGRDSVLATREPCRPTMSRGGSAASCRSVTSASISGRRRQRKSRSLLSVASRSKDLLNDGSSCHPGFFSHHSPVRGRGTGRVQLPGPGPGSQGDAAGRRPDRVEQSRWWIPPSHAGSWAACWAVLATCSQHAATRAGPALSQFWPLGTNSEQIRNVWNSRGTNPELSVNA